MSKSPQSSAWIALNRERGQSIEGATQREFFPSVHGLWPPGMTTVAHRSDEPATTTGDGHVGVRRAEWASQTMKFKWTSVLTNEKAQSEHVEQGK